VEEEELECKICYCPYSLSRRRPKLLHCCHRLCCLCLAQLLALGESPATTVVCPFCRYVTSLPPSSLPDDHGLLALLGRNLRIQTLQGGSTELLLTPRTLSSLLGAGNPSFSSFLPQAPGSYASIRGSPNFVVITIMEPPPPPPALPPQPPSALSPLPLGRSPYNLRQHRPPPGPPLQAALMYRSASSLDSVASGARRRGGGGVRGCAALLWRGSARALVWLLGLLYFCSLPLGVYLLIMQKTTLGVLLVSLVPTSIMVVIIYGFCQCLCQELWDCIPP
ncbi:E3 ubiquitin-protein ligase RNF182, partial [Gadus chalcogrammus]|uniref:E3 ubiquitin-protein ligase RNF182 n=1 Tax=Gadus chalcogrammus TaxID=1042646 RepID=UPI0024C4E538